MIDGIDSGIKGEDITWIIDGCITCSKETVNGFLFNKQLQHAPGV